MTQSADEAVVTKRFVHPSGTVSHFHVRDGRVYLTSVHPEHSGNPAELTREEVSRAWDEVAAGAKTEGLMD